ncbi:Cleavage and polyadenylation specificity factor subunit 5 [Tritrichomonas foetus]|uniref:Cleavage and polyadenylation specificity factor subunit 5 n=1 Tax=Tritrichomonas foetus TaxID=1144522 RepID=A0A1J4J5M5_9EUKA|nr:Cleavage and polyadenylation specificity factor subunit 5 [Tritrichomonas foetus]|eukprot:OHS93431.1 Cleavage and polyadenylation specificity factor subunit 5 [Tritrichomonas foetus]
MASSPPIQIYSLEQYTCGTGEADDENKEEKPKIDKMQKLREINEKSGLVRTVRAIILVHMYNHPYVLLLEKLTGDKSIIIPGGRLALGEDDETGLQRLLAKKLRLVKGPGPYEIINDLLSCWYRPQYTEQMFPYCPVHVTTPKEVERWYLVLLPENGSLCIPPKYKLHAVPFYDLQDGVRRYGKQLPTIPLLVSRFNIIPRPIPQKDD